MKIKLLLLTILCYCGNTLYSQDYKGVDEHALADTRVIGKIDTIKPQLAIPASKKSLSKFLIENINEPFCVFPEERSNSIELYHTIPEVWTKRRKEDCTKFYAKVSPGEFYVFQIGVFANSSDLKDLKYKSKGISGITCFNLEGISNKGIHFEKSLNINKGDVQPLWFGVNIPQSTKKNINGEIKLYTSDGKSKSIKISLVPDDNVVDNYGYNDDWRLSRLNWLNSQIEQNEEVTKGYIPLEYSNGKISILGREIILSSNGFPLEINSYFDSGNMKLTKSKEPILYEDIKFELKTKDNGVIKLTPGKLKITKKTPRRISWEVEHKSDNINLKVIGEATCEGIIDYQLKLSASQNVSIKDICLKIPMTSSKSEYMMGMGKEGGIRPNSWYWKWDINKSQDIVWIGGVNGGLSLKLKDNNYKKQLVNIYYPYGKLNIPESWDNNNLGGCNISSTDKGAIINAYSGARVIEKGECLYFNFELMITPFKLLSSNAIFNERFYQNSNKDLADTYLEEANNVGANIITIHHKKDLNPFINYPYLSDNTDRLKNFVKNMHLSKKQVCLYYTTRELSVIAPEIWAFKSLGDEVIFPGPGNDVRTVINPEGPHPWLVNRFKENFIPAWRCAIQEGKYSGSQDISVITTPETRFDNYYLEGLDWLCKNVGIDGIYLDGTALDRDALRRARKILDKNRPSALIDFHIWNNFREKGYYANGINLYMDLLPFIDHLWIGEGRSYDNMPDYWLVEMSGIPFGLPSQMLNHGGNRWRGMVFGLTNRPGWYGPTPKYIWKFWDDNDISKMEFIGFWNNKIPVKTDNSNVYATVYKSKDKAIISVANWSNESHVCKLYIDWEKLGFNPLNAKVKIPYIEEFQDEQNINLNESMKIKGGQGYLILITK